MIVFYVRVLTEKHPEGVDYSGRYYVSIKNAELEAKAADKEPGVTHSYVSITEVNPARVDVIY